MRLSPPLRHNQILHLHCPQALKLLHQIIIPKAEGLAGNFHGIWVHQRRRSALYVVSSAVRIPIWTASTQSFTLFQNTQRCQNATVQKYLPLFIKLERYCWVEKSWTEQCQIGQTKQAKFMSVTKIGLKKRQNQSKPKMRPRAPQGRLYSARLRNIG